MCDHCAIAAHHRSRPIDFSIEKDNFLTFGKPFPQITVVLPDVRSIPAELESALADSDHYLVRNISLQALINRSFIEAFVKRGWWCHKMKVKIWIEMSLLGSFYALSFRTRLDTDDCVAVTPIGTLVLHLNKETYQTLGLDGRVSEFARKRNSKYGK